MQGWFIPSPPLTLAVRPQPFLSRSWRLIVKSMSAAATARRLDNEHERDRLSFGRAAAGIKINFSGETMSEKIITTQNGVYGRLQVTLPMPAKSSMMSWAKKSGMKKAEFLRTALMIGAIQLANDLRAKHPDEGYFEGKDISLRG